MNLTQQPVSIVFPSCFRADRGPNKTVSKVTKTAILRVVTGCDAGTRAGASPSAAELIEAIGDGTDLE